MSWLRKYRNILEVGMILISQVFLRLYFIVDNHFLATHGGESLVIHNILQILMNTNQFLGIGISLSCLIFWKRPEFRRFQKKSILQHLLLAVFCSGLTGVLFLMGANLLLASFAVPQTLFPVAHSYFRVGALCGVLLTVYLTLDGLLIASGQAYLSVILALGLTATKWVLVHSGWNGNVIGNGNEKFLGLSISPLLAIGFLSLILYSVGIIIALFKVQSKAQGREALGLRTLTPIWSAELGSALIRATSAMAMGYGISQIKSNGNFIVTYQLLAHLSYLASLPLGAGMQVALRDSNGATDQSSHSKQLFYSAFLPTLILFGVGVVFPDPILGWIYDYHAESDHFIFMRLFFLYGLLIQCSRVPSVILRAKKQSRVITQNYLISEWVLLVGGLGSLIALGAATPSRLGWVMLGSGIFLCCSLTFQASDFFTRLKSFGVRSFAE